MINSLGRFINLVRTHLSNVVLQTEDFPLGEKKCSFTSLFRPIGYVESLYTVYVCYCLQDQGVIRTTLTSCGLTELQHTTFMSVGFRPSSEHVLVTQKMNVRHLHSVHPLFTGAQCCAGFGA